MQVSQLGSTLIALTHECADNINAMTVRMTRVRVDRELADDAVRVLGVKSRTEAAHVTVRWILGLDRSNERTPDLAENRINGTLGYEYEGL
jgi:Arc/MetJ family transcription regulator